MEIIGKIPEFTTDGAQPNEVETVDGNIETEKETPEEEKPAQEGDDIRKAELEQQAESIPQLDKAVSGLKEEYIRLRKEIDTLKGSKRELKKDELLVVQNKLDELNDLNEGDVNLVERILKAKGYVTKEESQKMFYESVKNEELAKFLEQYPEYKPENDPYDTNWNTLQKELSYYRMPSDPKAISEILLRSHKAIKPQSNERGTIAKKKQLEVASIGAGGTQRSSSSKNSLSSQQREELSRGGWSKEDIDEIEKNLN